MKLTPKLFCSNIIEHYFSIPQEEVFNYKYRKFREPKTLILFKKKNKILKSKKLEDGYYKKILQ